MNYSLSYPKDYIWGKPLEGWPCDRLELPKSAPNTGVGKEMEARKKIRKVGKDDELLNEETSEKFIRLSKN